MILYGIISLVIVIIDQISKFSIITHLTPSSRLILIPNIINIVYKKNTGAAFSILSDHVYLLGIISAIFCIAVAMFFVIKRPKNPIMCTAMSMIFAGALGNGIDRIFRGFVIDFIETDFIQFPVFNIADISITIGAALLMVYVIFLDKNEEKA